MKNSNDNLGINANSIRATLESAQAFATAICVELQRLEKENEDLRGWVAGVEADNTTLRNEIARLKGRTVQVDHRYKGDPDLQRLANDAMTRH
jgi:predicted nuclease with TOPRIM domain